MQSQVKTGIPLCRHGMRDDCPVEQCQIRNAQPSLLYSSILKGSAPTPPALDSLTTTNGTFAQQRQFGTHDKFPAETRRFQHSTAAPLYPTVNDPAAQMLSCDSSASTGVGMGSVEPMDGSGLAQASDNLAFYRVWLQSQMDAQMTRVRKMSEQFSIPIPNLELKPFVFPPLSLMPPPAGDTATTTTTKSSMLQENSGGSIIERPKVFSAPPAPRMPPALPVPGVWQPQGSPPTTRTNSSGPFSARAPRSPRPSTVDQPKPVTPAGVVSHTQATSIAPKKEDMAYQTTPCRHFTVNRGWCPWGDECGFIHDLELEWVPASGRTSGRSTPSSSTLGGNRPVLHDKITIESDINQHRSVSSKSAHCWGYIQGICPHSETCKYLHPADIVPYMKYTPCLTWPRCGYPVQECPLKHLQVDKLSPPRRSQPPSAPSATPIAPRAETFSNRHPQQHSQLPSMAPDSHTPAGGLVIPHDEAYASARLHHRPTLPSAEMFTPAPVQPVVRLRRPSGDVPQDQALQMQSGLGMGGHQGRARSASIAVQNINPEFSGPVLQTQAKGFTRGHGRGKSLNL